MPKRTQLFLDFEKYRYVGEISKNWGENSKNRQSLMASALSQPNQNPLNLSRLFDIVTKQPEHVLTQIHRGP